MKKIFNLSIILGLLAAVAFLSGCAAHVGFGDRQRLEPGIWHRAESDGFAVLNVTDKAAGRVGTSIDGEGQRGDVFRSRAEDETSTTILVPKGRYFRADRTNKDGVVSLYWVPLISGK